MSLTFSVRQGPARLAQRLPELSKAAFRPATAAAPARAFHTSQPMKRMGAGFGAGFFSSRITSQVASRNVFQRTATQARSYYQQSQSGGSSVLQGEGLRKLLVGGAIFGGTLVAINMVFNRETRDDGGMPPFEREYLNNTFLHTGLGIGIIGLTARQMVKTGFVYRIMVTNPWVVAIGGLALSFGTMIGTRSISPDK